MFLMLRRFKLGEVTHAMCKHGNALASVMGNNQKLDTRACFCVSLHIINHTHTITLRLFFSLTHAELFDY